MLFLSDMFSKEAVIPTCSQSSEFTITLATSRSDDVFPDLTANSIFGVIMLSIAVKIAFWILFSTVSTTCSFPQQSYQWEVSQKFKNLLCSHWLMISCQYCLLQILGDPDHHWLQHFALHCSLRHQWKFLCFFTAKKHYRRFPGFFRKSNVCSEIKVLVKISCFWTVFVSVICFAPSIGQ